MAQNNADATEAKPEIVKVEYNFPTEDDLRLSRRGKAFEDMQDHEIEFVNADRQIANKHGNDAVRIWFKNGAHMRYELVDEDTTVEATYQADTPSAAWDSIRISLTRGGRSDFVACVENSMAEYLDSRRETVEDFEGDWTTVYEIIQ